MLVLSLRRGQIVFVGSTIIIPTEIGGDRIRMGFHAHKHVRILNFHVLLDMVREEMKAHVERDAWAEGLEDEDRQGYERERCALRLVYLALTSSEICVERLHKAISRPPIRELMAEALGRDRQPRRPRARITRRVSTTR